MATRPDIVYPITFRKAHADNVIIKAGTQSIDAKRQIISEGIGLQIPKVINDLHQIDFAVISIKKAPQPDTFLLRLHTHTSIQDMHAFDDECGIEPDGDVESRIILSKDMLKIITGLTARQIDDAFSEIHMGNTYQLMMRLPRKIIIEQGSITITFGESSTHDIDTANVCGLLLNDTHPLDKKETVKKKKSSKPSKKKGSFFKEI